MPNDITVDAALELALKDFFAANHQAVGDSLHGYPLLESQGSGEIADKARVVVACFDLGGDLLQAGIHDIGTHFIVYTPVHNANGEEAGQELLHQRAVQAINAILQVPRIETVKALLNVNTRGVAASCFRSDGEPRRGRNDARTCFVADIPFTFVAHLT